MHARVKILQVEKITDEHLFDYLDNPEAYKDVFSKTPFDEELIGVEYAGDTCGVVVVPVSLVEKCYQTEANIEKIWQQHEEAIEKKNNKGKGKGKKKKSKKKTDYEEGEEWIYLYEI